MHATDNTSKKVENQRFKLVLSELAHSKLVNTVGHFSGLSKTLANDLISPSPSLSL